MVWCFKPEDIVVRYPRRTALARERAIKNLTAIFTCKETTPKNSFTQHIMLPYYFFDVPIFLSWLVRKRKTGMLFGLFWNWYGCCYDVYTREFWICPDIIDVYPVLLFLECIRDCKTLQQFSSLSVVFLHITDAILSFPPISFFSHHHDPPSWSLAWEWIFRR